MAKARRQRAKIVKGPNGQKLNKGDSFVVGGGMAYRYLGIDREGRVLVKLLPHAHRSRPEALRLSVEEELEGCDLHLMEEEAIVLAALTQLIANLREDTPAKFRKPGNGLDATHDLEYWLRRIQKALADAGYPELTTPVTGTYWQLGDLLESYHRAFVCQGGHGQSATPPPAPVMTEH